MDKIVSFISNVFYHNKNFKTSWAIVSYIKKLIYQEKYKTYIKNLKFYWKVKKKIEVNWKKYEVPVCENPYSNYVHSSYLRYKYFEINIAIWCIILT